MTLDAWIWFALGHILMWNKQKATFLFFYLSNQNVKKMYVKGKQMLVIYI